MYEEYALNKAFIESLDVSNCYSIRAYCGNKKDTNLHDLAFLAKSIFGCGDGM